MGAHCPGRENILSLGTNVINSFTLQFCIGNPLSSRRELCISQALHTHVLKPAGSFEVAFNGESVCVCKVLKGNFLPVRLFSNKERFLSFRDLDQSSRDCSGDLGDLWEVSCEVESLNAHAPRRDNRGQSLHCLSTAQAKLYDLYS